MVVTESAYSNLGIYMILIVIFVNISILLFINKVYFLTGMFPWERLFELSVPRQKVPIPLYNQELLEVFFISS